MILNTLSQNIFVIDDFLSQEDCQQFISQAERSGFQAADVDTGTNRKLITNIRNNERVDWESANLAQDWWKKLSVLSLPVIEDMHAIGLSPHFRFYKYSSGQKFNMHKDGRQNVNGEITVLTLLVYLNEGYLGGETKFRQDDINISPKLGKALIFDHHLWHQGTQLQAGSKYVLRTDVIYQ